MKKINLLLFLALLGLAGSAKAVVNESFITPLDANHVPDANAKYGSVSRCILAASTTPAMAVDINGSTMTAGFLRWVIRPSSGAAGTYIEFRDTNTANVTSSRIIPWIMPLSSGSTTQQITVTDQLIKFEPPVPFFNGLSFNLIPLNSAPAAGFEYSIGVERRR